MQVSRGLWCHAPQKKIYEIWNVGDALFSVFRICFRQCELEKRGLTMNTPPPPPPPDLPQRQTAYFYSVS